MYLIANGKKTIELRLLNYEFQEAESCNNEYDLNWLNVSIKVETKQMCYKACSACMLTWEVEDMIEGMGRVLALDEFCYQAKFLEPILNIEFNGFGKIVEVDFRCIICASDDVSERYWSKFSITKREFGEAIRQLKGERSKFPRR